MLGICSLKKASSKGGRNKQSKQLIGKRVRGVEGKFYFSSSEQKLLTQHLNIAHDEVDVLLSS